MHPVILVPLVACLLAVTIATAIISHDPGQRANRLVAMVLACSAWWSLCEVLWNIQKDPDLVLWLVKASGLAWTWLGALALDLFVEVQGNARSRLRKLVPLAYATAAGGALLYLASPWCLREVVPTSWGWGYRFGPLFPLVYAPTMGFVVLALVNWPRLFAGAPLEGRQARWMFVGIAVPSAAVSVTDVLLPYLDVHVPRLGSTSILAMGCVVAWSLRRHGYLLLAPGAFAREILETLHDGVALLRPDGRIVTCNQGLARLVGRDPERLRDAPISDFLPGLPAAVAGELRDLRIELRPVEGEAVPVSVSSSPLREEKNRSVGEVLVIRDLREVTALRSRLVTSGRIAAVGEVAAGIAHEIANPITFVRANLVQLRHHWQAFAQAAEKNPTDPGLETLLVEGEELIAESVEGVDRVASIVRHVGAFSHAGPGHFERVDVNELLENAVGVAALSFSVIVERCYAELPPVHGDPQQLKQVFLNLLLNALQAVGDYGKIRLVTQRRGERVVIRVEDDGPGISEDAIDRIFDPFFTTRPAGEGLGLGLAHCCQIVRHHGGEICARSKPGLGATFEIRLPAARDENAVRNAGQPAAARRMSRT